MAFKKFSKKPKAFKRKRVVKPSKSLVKVIQSVVHRDAETKSAYHQQNLVAFDNDIDAVDIYRIVPNIIQGVDDNQRIGSKVKSMVLTVKGHLILSALLAPGYTKVAVRLMILQPKQCQNYTTITGTTFGTGWTNTLMEKGGVSVAFTGSISDLYANVDKDSSTVYYDKIHYISTPQLLTATGVADTRQTISFFTMNLKLNKSLVYNDSLDGVQPQNCSPVLLAGYTYLDGTAAGALANVSIAYNSYLTYQDS